MDVKLIVVGGDAKTTEITLKLPTIIGRGRGSTLTLAHPLVSRQHCELYEADGVLFVRDLGSLNGTFIGNEPITEAELPPGELLTVGAVTFRALYGDVLEREPDDNHRAQPAPRKRHDAPTTVKRDPAVETVSEPSAEKSRSRKSDATKPSKPSSSPKRSSPTTQDETALASGHVSGQPQRASSSRPAAVDDEAFLFEEVDLADEQYVDEEAEVADESEEAIEMAVVQRYVARLRRDDDLDALDDVNDVDEIDLDAVDVIDLDAIEATDEASHAEGEVSLDEVTPTEGDTSRASSTPPAPIPSRDPASSEDDNLQAFFRNLK
jgi:hypothetical protein